MNRLSKIFIVLLVGLMLSASAHAMLIPTMADVKKAANDKNLGRDHIDIIVRNRPDPGGAGASGDTNYYTHYQTATATEGSIVVWATDSGAVFGRDVSVTAATDCTLVAGIVVEPGGIASGAFGRVRIYGYFDDVICADAKDAIAVGTLIGTTDILGQSGASGGSGVGRAGVSLGAGAGANSNLIECLINVTN